MERKPCVFGSYRGQLEFLNCISRVSEGLRLTALHGLGQAKVIGIIARFVRRITLKDRRSTVSTSTHRLCDPVSRCPANAEMFCGSI